MFFYRKPKYMTEIDLMHEDLQTSKEADELFEHYHFKVDKGQSLLRIDKFLTNRIEGISRTRVSLAADAGFVLVNGNPAKASYKVKPLDEISVVMPYERRGLEIISENIPIEIVFEDEDLMVVNKTFGMVVHPGHGNYKGTLVNALAYHLEKQGKTFDSESERAGLLVHRIDKNTAGLLVIAKTDAAHAKLARQFFDHTSIRRYTALIWGLFDSKTGTIEGNIGRSPHDRLKMKIFPDGSQGKRAVTHYKVIEELGYVSIVECRLETGRTHQIRAHMEFAGHPLFNDERYGGNKILRGTTFSKYRQFVENCFAMLPGQALHAGILGFRHPSTGEEMLFEAPLPPNMNALIEKWRNYGTQYR
jgi:23S rRNA pseudouridine1911/1915/1917 synthase